MSTNNEDGHAAASGHVACDSHGENAGEENRDPKPHSMRDDCCGGSADLAYQAHGHAHPTHRHEQSKGGGCCGPHAEPAPSNPKPSSPT